MGLGHGYRPQMPTSAGQPANPPPAPLTTCAAPGTGALAPLEDEPAQSQALGEACGRGKRGGGLRPDVTALDVAGGRLLASVPVDAAARGIERILAQD